MRQADSLPQHHDIHVLIDGEEWARQNIDYNKLIPTIVEYVLKVERVSEFIELNVRLTTDKVMQQLNKDFRQKDKPTNVLSFPSDGEDDPYCLSNLWTLGDMALGYETIEKEAQAQSKSFKDHFIHLLIHGILHLLGFNHLTDEEAEEMESLEIRILENLGIPNPYLNQEA